MGEHNLCPRCKRVISRSQMRVSGYDSEHSQRHIHCPNCGRIIAWPTEGSKLKDIVEGAGLITAGGALAFLLFSSLEMYAVQLGLYVSLFGAFKILI